MNIDNKIKENKSKQRMLAEHHNSVLCEQIRYLFAANESLSAAILHGRKFNIVGMPNDQADIEKQLLAIQQLIAHCSRRCAQQTVSIDC